MSPPGCCVRATGLEDLDDATAREQVRHRFADADEEDLVMLGDLLGIRDPAVRLPQIDPDARRRRVTAMVKAAALARTDTGVYVIEDAHWIDGTSESMLADFLTRGAADPIAGPDHLPPGIPGALAHTPSQTIALAPLNESQMLGARAELLGQDSSVAELAELITARAAGNPFFAEEIVRDLSRTRCPGRAAAAATCASATSPMSTCLRTLQAAIAARIDRLDPPPSAH